MRKSSCYCTHVNNQPENPHASSPVQCTPEWFPLPARGYDRHFGLGRSSFYDLERRGLLRLVRIKKPGNVRGKVLVPYAETAALIRRLSNEGKPTA